MSANLSCAGLRQAIRRMASIQVNGHRLRHHSRPKELQTRRIPQHIRLHRHPVPYYHPALSSLVSVASSSFITVPVSQSPPSSFASRICAKFICPPLRSAIHSSSGNPSTSRQNTSRPRGAPHLPHIRNTLEIVLPQPLTPTSFPDYTG
ncbi:hypothetical protein BS47DRAFT_775852 [Hydnum rufescens UP504]|uniref:Uncharacterized protein n=1 Tax=Hydnum rufescens UP504 TaxID=1448309 RepID=A0A9P6AD70_9AGAM|nr:hypothetical protein BS47DRAFT_775852 [Hydnum rufescens UP504]